MAAIAIAVAVVVVILSFGLAEEAGRRGNWSVARRLDPLSAAPRLGIAKARLKHDDAVAAASAARDALVRAPLSAAALRTLAAALEQTGDRATANEALGRAAVLGWRDLPTQRWSVRSALAGGDLATALNAADALARQGVNQPLAFRLFGAAAQTDEGRSLLAARLAVSPPWRPAFFSAVSRLSAGEERGRIALFQMLAASGTPAAPSEVAPFVDRLIARRAYSAARQLWWRWIVRAGGAPPLLYDGRRDAAAGRQPGDTPTAFDWAAADSVGGSASLDRTGGGSALAAESSGSTGSVFAEQSLVLSPGRYRLSYRAEGDDPAAAQAFEWWVECLPRRIRLWLDQPAAPISGRVAGSFVIPAAGCPAQRLTLRGRNAEVPGDYHLRFADIAIDRLP